MICPKCSREMGNDANSCPYCGFTFLTPKGSDAIHSIPYYSTAAEPRIPREPIQSVIQDLQRPIERTDYAAAQLPAEPLSISRYIGLLLLSLIPVVGFVVFIVLAAARNGNPNQRRFAGAMLILKSIGLMFLLGAAIVYIVYATPLFFYFFR